LSGKTFIANFMFRFTPVLDWCGYRARQLYKNISMLFLFPVKDVKLTPGVIAIFNASCYG